MVGAPTRSVAHPTRPLPTGTSANEPSVAMLVTPGGAGGVFDTHLVLGALAIQGGAIAWQYGTVRAKYNLAKVPPLMSSAMQMLSGGIAVTVIFAA